MKNSTKSIGIITGVGIVEFLSFVMIGTAYVMIHQNLIGGNLNNIANMIAPYIMFVVCTTIAPPLEEWVRAKIITKGYGVKYSIVQAVFEGIVITSSMTEQLSNIALVILVAIRIGWIFGHLYLCKINEMKGVKTAIKYHMIINVILYPVGYLLLLI